MARSDNRPRAYYFKTVLMVLASMLAACAEYNDKAAHLDAAGGVNADNGGTGGADAPGGSVAVAGDMSDLGGSAAAGRSGSPSGGRSNAGGGSGRGGSGGSFAGAPNGGSAGGATGGAGGVTGGSGTGATAGGAAGGMAGGGAGGMVGGAAGGSGAPAVEQLLSRGKPSTTDSAETGHEAPFGNDGVTTTRYCAANGAVGHHWQVDLGQSRAITRLHILWEKSALYQFKIEGSQDNVAYSSVLDETKSTSTSANQTYLLAGTVDARYVRLTATSLPAATAWLSFFEFEVFGH